MSAIVAASVFLTAMCVLAVRGMLPSVVPAVYVVASAATVVAYAIDKAAARSGAWRLPQSALHGFAIIGGWPGALVAREIFRHKTQKLSFQFTFWATVALNCGALVWLWWSKFP